MKAFHDNNGQTVCAAIRVPSDQPQRPLTPIEYRTVGIVAYHLRGPDFGSLLGYLLDGERWACRGDVQIDRLRRCLSSWPNATLAELEALLRSSGGKLDGLEYSGRSLFEAAACRASFELRPVPISVPTVCSTVRCLHPLTGEFVNIGAVAWRHDKISSQFASSLVRARALQCDVVAITALRERFVAEAVTLDELRDLCRDGKGSIQFDGPYTSPHLPPREAVDRLIAVHLRPEDLMPEP